MTKRHLKRRWVYTHRALRLLQPFLEYLILLSSLFNEVYSLAEKING